VSIRGRRDSVSDGWSWEPVAERDGPRLQLAWWPVLAVILAVSLLGGLAAGVLVSNNDGDNASGVDDTATPSLPTVVTASPQPTLTLSPTPILTPAQTTSAPAVHLFAWSRADKRWVETELPAGAGYREGEAIPVLLRLDHAAPASPDATTDSYEVIVRYQCATEKGAAIDFLASPTEVDSAAVLSDPGPRRGLPDSMVAVPDDPAITFDDAAANRVQLWGGAFLRAPEGPLPATPCEREKEVHLGVGATQDTVFLVWAAHLASARDWGENQGTASAGGPLSIEVVVIGAGEASLSVAAGAVLP
jgi:hypothetical protein